LKATLLILAIIVSIALAYTLRFTEATLSFGRELDDKGSPTGFQAAVSPPWETYLGLANYGATILVIVAAFWREGWAWGLGVILLLFFGVLMSRLTLPKPTSAHYRSLIVQSMMSRYANYLRDGDKLRAEAMKRLLVKAGFDPDVMNANP
jgi:hypothetical protein